MRLGDRARVVAGAGATLTLDDGRSIVDFASAGFGHGASEVIAAVARQLHDNPLASRHFLSLPLARAAAALAHACPGDLEVSYLCSSHAEAVEGALKLARGYDPGRRRLVAVWGSSHGATLGALSVNGAEGMRKPFSTLPFETRFAKSPDRVLELVDHEVGAVIVEPWPGAAGRVEAPTGWLRELRARCSATGTLLIADETRTGLGRTGRTFAVEHERVTPDVLVVGGALGGDVLPVAGYVAAAQVNARVYGRRDPTLHASATGGNPAACVAALAALKVLASAEQLARVEALGSLMKRRLERLARVCRPVVVAVACSGLLGRVVLRGGTRLGVQLVEAAYDHGLALTFVEEAGGRVAIDLCPPLRAEKREIVSGVAALESALLSLESGTRCVA